MKILELFNICAKSSGYITTKHKASYKEEDGVLYFQCSRESSDWLFNFLAFPVPLIVRKKLIFVPFGVAFLWRELWTALKGNHYKAAIGYSQGAEFAALFSAYTGCRAYTFGCPAFFIGDKRIFANVESFQTPGDVIANDVPFYRTVRDTIRLPGGRIDIPKVDGAFDIVAWLSGHTPAEYRLRLALYNKEISL